MFANVIVGVREDEAGNDAIALARELVAKDRRLTLVHVHVVAKKPAPDSAADSDSAKCRKASEELTDLAKGLHIEADVACVEAGSARSGLHYAASSRNADLLVIGATRADELARDIVGDDTREILDGAPCAVAVAPGGYASEAAGLRKIGVAFDGSTGSERAVEVARGLAADCHAELSAFEAVAPPAYAHDPWNVRGDMEQSVEAARRRVAALGDVEAEAGAGDVAEQLGQFGASVDLLIVGAHEYTPVDHVSERSLPQQLADKASSPLLCLAPA